MSRIVGSTRLTILKTYDQARAQAFLEFVMHTLRKIVRSKESKSCIILPKCLSSNTAGFSEVVLAQTVTSMHSRQEIKKWRSFGFSDIRNSRMQRTDDIFRDFSMDASRSCFAWAKSLKICRTITFMTGFTFLTFEDVWIMSSSKGMFASTKLILRGEDQ